MSTTSPTAPTVASDIDPTAGARTTSRSVRALPLLGLATAVAGILGSTVLNGAFIDDPAVYDRGPEAVFAMLSDHLTTQLGAAALYLTAVLLVIFAGGLRTFLRTRPAGAASAQSIHTMLVIGAGVITVGGILKSILASGLPGGTDALYYTEVDVAVLHTLSGQFQYAAFLPIVAAAGVMAVASLRHRVLPRYVGAFSAVIAVAVTGVTIAVNLPWSAGLVGPLWLLAVSFGVWRVSRRA